MKTCRNCGVTRELTEFKKNGYTKKGTQTYKPHCKICMNLMLRNSLKDTIVMVRGNPILVPNEKRLKKNEHMREYRQGEKKEEHNRKNREYYHSLSPEIKKERQIKNTKRRKLARQKARLDLINKKRQCIHSL